MCKKNTASLLKNKELAKEYDVSEGMISDILKSKNHWLAIDYDNLIHIKLVCDVKGNYLFLPLKKP